MTHAAPMPVHGPNPFNRADRAGVLLSAAVPLLAAIVANLLIWLTGWSQENAAYEAVSFSPPGWVVGTIWLIIFPMWGYARWKSWQAGPDGRRESWWAVALIFWALAYPVAVLFLDTLSGAWANVASLAFAAIVCWRLARASKPAARWLVPSLAWLTFASFLGFAAVSTGV